MSPRGRTSALQLAEQVALMRRPDAVAAHATRAAEAARRAIARLERKTWTAAEARRMMLPIARDRARLSSDIQVAEQTALAVQSLATHLASADDGFSRGRTAAALESLFAAVESPDDYDEHRFESLLAQMGSSLASR